MSNSVTLGAVTFGSFEVPERIRYGGQQRSVVHDLPGGGRIVDVLGSSGSVITFGGILSGVDAELRARTLDAMRVAGLPIPLVWGENYFLVILAKLTLTYQKSWWIPYQVQCIVSADPLAILTTAAASTASLVANNLLNASSVLTDAPPGLTAAQSSLTQVGGLTPGTASFSSSLSGLSSVYAGLQTNLAQTPEWDITLPGGNAASAIQNLSGIGQAASTLASGAAASGYIGSSINLLTALGG